MFSFVKGLAGAAVKTVVGVPVAVVADVITAGGAATGKRGSCYTADMFESLGESLDEMTE